MTRTAIVLSLLVLAVPALGAAAPTEPDRRIALTFDDLPAQRAGELPEARLQRILPALISALDDGDVPAIGFVNEVKLEVDGRIDPSRVALLERWLDAGLELGNHTYSHPDVHRIPLDDFLANILDGERISRPMVQERGDELRYFRHPFLHTGTDLETKHAVERFLSEHGYRVAPVTVDNSEWIFARAYDEALDRDAEDQHRRLGATYVDYMEAMVEFYEGQSRALFEREIPQVLLVHANDLNADHLPALLARLRQRGYRFVDLEDALADPAYDSPDTYVGRGGITWLHRWAITRRVDRSIFAGEPTTPEWVKELAGIRD